MKIIVERPDKPLTKQEREIIDNANNVISIFLAGTIDMGTSYDWQTEYINNLQDLSNANTYSENDYYKVLGVSIYDPDSTVIIVYNPRRDNMPDDIDSQINWELDRLERTIAIYMNLLADSKSPISLLELGLFAKSGKLKVTCPKEFYRYDNVRVTCKKYNVPLRNSVNEYFNN